MAVSRLLTGARLIAMFPASISPNPLASSRNWYRLTPSNYLI